MLGSEGSSLAFAGHDVVYLGKWRTNHDSQVGEAKEHGSCPIPHRWESLFASLTLLNSSSSCSCLLLARRVFSPLQSQP